MNLLWRHAVQGLAHLLFPQTCRFCGRALSGEQNLLCLPCFRQLPPTGFFNQSPNPVEKIFYGRLPVHQAGALYYFTRHSPLQQLVFALKYQGCREAGLLLGELMGEALRNCGRFNDVDLVVPLPLSKKRLRERGYNQAALIAAGLCSAWPKELCEEVVARRVPTATQTKKNRVSRWQSMENVFALSDATPLLGKHVLLVDDVVTTGATLEACGQAILSVPGTRLSVATAAYTALR